MLFWIPLTFIEWTETFLKIYSFVFHEYDIYLDITKNVVVRILVVKTILLRKYFKCRDV